VQHREPHRQWHLIYIHEIAKRHGAQVRLYSRPGNDLTYRFPLIVETLARLRSRSCIIDGEAVACDDNGVALFNRVRYRHYDESIFLYAFDLIELNGDDLRPDPLEGRKATLETILAKAGLGIRFNKHMDGDGETVFRHACSFRHDPPTLALSPARRHRLVEKPGLVSMGSAPLTAASDRLRQRRRLLVRERH
jgi:hypothetical protein